MSSHSRNSIAVRGGGNMYKFNWSMKTCSILILWAATAAALPAQTFTTLHSFDGTDGGFPSAGLVQGTNGKFYGTTSGGGAYGDGTVFSITAGGTLTTLHSFSGSATDGANPIAGLVQGTNGDFYGTTFIGGAYDGGTVFSITASGTLTTLYSFRGAVGSYPTAGLVQGANGKFYGTTPPGGGTVFSITANGTPTKLYTFCSGGGVCADGSSPGAGLVQGTNGKFYGTTNSGGANGDGDGTVFSITA